FFFVFALLILSFNFARFIFLEQSPPGFHVDELSHAVVVQCLAEEGVDIYGHHFSLFGERGYGNPDPPTSMFFSALWTKIFGYSIGSFRAVSGFITLLTLLGL